MVVGCNENPERPRQLLHSSLSWGSGFNRASSSMVIFPLNGRAPKAENAEQRAHNEHQTSSPKRLVAIIRWIEIFFIIAVRRSVSALREHYCEASIVKSRPRGKRHVKDSRRFCVFSGLADRFQAIARRRSSGCTLFVECS